MNISNSLNDCKKINLPKIEDSRGNLTVIENTINIPFNVKRVFYVYDIPTAKKRGAHAHKTLEQFLICLSGGLDVRLNDGINKKKIHLNRPWEGLYIPPMIWASERNFDSGTVYLVLCSDLYDESDYIRNYSNYLEYMQS